MSQPRRSNPAPRKATAGLVWTALTAAAFAVAALLACVAELIWWDHARVRALAVPLALLAIAAAVLSLREDGR